MQAQDGYTVGVRDLSEALGAEVPQSFVEQSSVASSRNKGEHRTLFFPCDCTCAHVHRLQGHCTGIGATSLHAGR
eukprot:3526521-Amphidinium_carterae.2